MSDYRGCFLQKNAGKINEILVGLERILDYAGVGLEKFDCIAAACGFKLLITGQCKLAKRQEVFFVGQLTTILSSLNLLLW